VLIDEVELHLHPGWQRRVLDDLRRTFPKLQFIVTTHSPQVVASVSRSQVRLLDNNKLVASEPFVQGRDTNELLEDVFGVPSRPEETKAELRRLFELIDAGNHVAARSKLAELEQRLGPDDAQIVRAGWILDSEEADRNAQSAAGT
jgi:predicted ATP-binding protein involved in virulence